MLLIAVAREVWKKITATLSVPFRSLALKGKAVAKARRSSQVISLPLKEARIQNSFICLHFRVPLGEFLAP